MLRVIKQVFIGLCFGRSLATKCVSLNNEPRTIRPTLIDLNPIELNYYQFMIRLDECSGSCNSVVDFSTKIWVPSKTKDIRVQLSITCNSNQKWNNETCQCEYKNYCTCKKDYSRNSSTCICENSKHLKHIVDNSVIACDEIIYVMDIVSTNMINAVTKMQQVLCQ